MTMFIGVKEAKNISMICHMDAKPRVETPTELSTKTQPLEKPKEEWEQPTTTQNTMPIHVLFPEVEDIGATKPKK